ncbi:MAG: MoaD/ThiS family protein [Pirellulales bacterium]
MPTIHIPPQMRDLTGGLAHIAVTGETLRQVLRALEDLHPGIAARLVVEDRIAPGLAVSIDGVVTSRGLLAKVGPASEIHILPAIGGG